MQDMQQHLLMPPAAWKGRHTAGRGIQERGSGWSLREELLTFPVPLSVKELQLERPDLVRVWYRQPQLSRSQGSGHALLRYSTAQHVRREREAFIYPVGGTRNMSGISAARLR